MHQRRVLNTRVTITQRVGDAPDCDCSNRQERRTTCTSFQITIVGDHPDLIHRIMDETNDWHAKYHGLADPEDLS